MKLDRDLHKNILDLLAASYPKSVNNVAGNFPTFDEYAIYGSLQYLMEHGLVISGAQSLPGIGASERWHEVAGTAITAAGLDFLADDGGLSAILDVVTVRFEVDTLRAIIEARITHSDLPPAEKKKFLDRLRELSAESIKHLTMKLLDKGLENLPATLPVIQTYLSSFLG